MASRYTECTDSARKDVKKLQKNNEGLYQLSVESLEKLTTSFKDAINCIVAKKRHESEIDNISIMKQELSDLKGMLKSARVVEQALMENILPDEAQSLKLKERRRLSKDRIRMVVSKLQERIFETSYQISERTRARERLISIVSAVVIVLGVQIIGLIIYDSFFNS